MLGQLFHGTAWSLLLRWSVRGIGLVNTVILARILVPEDFGIVAIATLVIGFLAMFSDMAVGLLLIRLEDPTREYCDTAWTIKVLQGVLLAVAVILLAPVAAAFFHEPRVESVLLLMSLVPLIVGAENIGIFLLMRDNRFDLDFKFRVCARIFLFLATLGFALVLRDYWAIVYGRLLGTVFETSLSYAFRPHWPRPSLAKAKELFSFSVTVLVSGIGKYLSAKLDVFSVGRLGTAATLGIYNVASELANMMTNELAISVARGSYPTYASLAHDGDAFSEAFYHSLATTLILSVPLGLGLSVTAADFAGVVFGAKWTALGPILAWLGLYGVTQAVTVPMTGGILVAAGQERIAAWSAWLQLAIRAAVVLPVAFLIGVESIAPAVVAAGVLGIPAAAVLLVRHTPVSAMVLFRAAWRPLFAGAVMAAVVTTLGPFLFNDIFLRLIAKVAIGGITYFAALYTLWRYFGRPAGPEVAILEFLTARLPLRR